MKNMNEEDIEIIDNVINEMLKIVRYFNDFKLESKFIELMNFKDDIYKKNRWFGYYQCKGEEKGYWTLEEIIEMVRKSKEEYKKKNTLVITKEEVPPESIPETGYKSYTIKGKEYAIGKEKGIIKIYELKRI
jgi:hypothetical protein